MRKEKDWSFGLKMSISGIFGIFMVFLLFFGKKAFEPMEEVDYKSGKNPLTNHKRPLRVQIMALNTITIFFLLMSVQEYRLNEFMSPFGVDPDKIPPQCKRQQEGYYWIVLFTCIIIIFYNLIIHSNILKTATKKNVLFEKKQQTASRNVGLVNDDIEKLKIRNGGFVVEKYPYMLEYLFAFLLALFSILMYILFVLNNYNVIEIKIFKNCFNPLDNKRFYDPFVEEETNN